MKHKLSSIAEQPWHPWLCTQYSPNRLITTSVLGFSPRMGFGWEVGKSHYAEETDQRYSTRRKCAVEERSHLTEDIRKPGLFFPLFICVLFVIALIIYSLGLSTLLSKSFITVHNSIISSCLFDKFSLSKLFVPIKVLYRQITGIYIRCA